MGKASETLRPENRELRLVAVGLGVEVLQRDPAFCRLRVSRDGDVVVVDLVAEPVPVIEAPVDELVRVLAGREELAPLPPREKARVRHPREMASKTALAVRGPAALEVPRPRVSAGRSQLCRPAC